MAYELLCGSQFESLFPGLSAFGRDTQIAWMMWHAAADRRLPEIGRVLEGVPKDLARVIERLVVKEQAGRYDSADAAIEDLVCTPTASSAAKNVKPEGDSSVTGLRVKRRRYMAVAAAALSAVLCVAMMAPGRPAPPAASRVVPGAGVITAVDSEKWRVDMTRPDSGETTHLKLSRDDHVFLNEHSCLLRDLRADDQLVVKPIRDASGRQIAELRAVRPIEHVGRVRSVELDVGRLTVLVEKGESAGQDMTFVIPGNATITINGQSQEAGQPYTLSSLVKDDYATVRHVGTEKGRLVIDVSALRTSPVNGVVQTVRPEARQADGNRQPRRSP